MKASYLEQHGGPEVLKYGELPDPKAGAGEIVVDIVAATVNGADWRVRAGGYGTALKFPYVLGRDFSGTVSALGEGVTDFKIGDAVFAVLPPGQEGTYAEKIAIKAAVIAKKPDGLSHVNAAALALAAHGSTELSAYTAEHLTGAVRRLMDRIAAVHGLRRDIGPEDVLHLLVALCYRSDAPGWQANVLRLLDVFVDGLRVRR